MDTRFYDIRNPYSTYSKGHIVAIDYQRLLMDMNRPARRQGKSMKKIFLGMVLMIGIFAATFAAWQYGVVHTAWRSAGNFLTSVIHGDAGGQAAAEDDAVSAELPRETRGSRLSAMVAPALQAVLAGESAPQAAAASPQSAVVLPVPAGAPVSGASSLRPVAPTPRNDTSPIDVAALSSSEPRSTPPAQPSLRPDAQPLPQASVAAPASVAVAVSPSPASVPASAPASGFAAVPVLSDAKAQLRVIDGMLSSNPAEAMARLDDLLATSLTEDDAAEAGYRKGYAARMLRDEASAEAAWRGTADRFPEYRGGRFSAMALGDTYFHRYAGNRSQMSYWDDISVMYSRALGRDDAPFLPEEVKAEIKRKLTVVNEQIIFGSAPTELARYHRVESGELLGSIANKYRVDYESISRVNGINPNRISVGMDLKILVGDVDIIVRKHVADSARTPTVTWYVGGRWAREYPACVGDGMKTPAGTYTFTLKERDPSWTNPLNGQLLPNNHPDNILGSRWMAMKGMNTQGLGIHGTTVDDSIPGYTSAGCVRLHNVDVEELFSFARIGGRVTIVD